MINITKENLRLLINKVGLTQASKQLKIGYLTIKKMCEELKIDVKKKNAGRKKNIKIL